MKTHISVQHHHCSSSKRHRFLYQRRLHSHVCTLADSTHHHRLQSSRSQQTQPNPSPSPRHFLASILYRHSSPTSCLLPPSKSPSSSSSPSSSRLQAPKMDASSSSTPPSTITIHVKHNSVSYQLEVSPSTTLLDVKIRLEQRTCVLFRRQKLLGLPLISSRVPPDDTPVSTFPLSFWASKVILLMGTPEAKLTPDPSLLEDLPDVVNDLDYDFMPSADSAGSSSSSISIASSSLESSALSAVLPVAPNGLFNPEQVRRKLLSRIDRASITLLNQPRPGKKLLVIDIDHCVFDPKSASPDIRIMMRPGTHEFLTAVYAHYELAFWSQTPWRFVEMKLTEMGILSHPNYRVLFVLDRSCMFSVVSMRHGEQKEHEVKALEIIWSKLPHHFNPKNTLHIDDLGRNFVLNPRNGIKIPAYKQAHINFATDRELFPLARYLIAMASLDDVTQVSHDQYREVVARFSSFPSQPSSSSSSQSNPPSRPPP